MPSPFPGMDPYLEQPRLWPDVHQALAGAMRAQLAPRLRPRYVARLATRYVVDEAEVAAVRVVYPDVDVSRATGRTGEALPAYPPLAGAEPPVVPAPLVLPAAQPIEVKLVTLELYDVTGQRLVTAIEIMSPVNKRPGEGLAAYRQRRRVILEGGASLVEVDLLRRGVRPPWLVGLPVADYCVFVTRAERPGFTEVWPLSVRDPLPVVPVPLAVGEPAVPLDLGAALNAAYDEAAYDLSIDYRQPPDPALSESDAEWAAAVVRGTRETP